MKNVLGIIVAAFMAAIVFVPTSAKAACNVWIYADRAYTDGSTTYVYGRPNGYDTYYYYGYTTNTNLAHLIYAATASGKRINVSANAASCPTTGSFRWFNVISYIFLSP
jgi:hypothetical protein